MAYKSNPTPLILGQLFAAALSGIVLFLLLSFTVLGGYQLIFAGRVFPGVSVAGIDVGGMTRAQAAAQITKDFQYLQTGKILLQYQEQAWMATPADLGTFLDADSSAKNALSVGRNGNLFERLATQFSVLFYHRDLPPLLISDQRTTHNVLTGLAVNIDKPVTEASLTVEGTEVVVHSGERGRHLDIPATLPLITAQIQTLQDGIIPLAVSETEPVIMDASAQAEVARKILSQPLTLTMPGGQPDQKGPWVFDQNSLASMLSVERVPEGDKAIYQVTINTQILTTFLANMAQDLSMYPQNARYIFNDDTRQLEVIQNAIVGRTLDIEASLKNIQEKAIQGEHSVELVFKYTNPPATDTTMGADLGITELIHAETSYFYGSSAARIQNISAAASRFHGVLVAPGETFSMATTLGDISLDNGYAEALIIIGGQTIQGVGGGVCQVSTTLFRTAFFAGFPIVERHAHAYRVSYYEKVAGNRIDARLAGLDATVFVPLVDFKFINDTPYWLLMETYVNPGNSSITWKFYSTSDGRTVDWTTTGPTNEVDPPEPLYRENPDLAKDEIRQVDWAAKGADITATRTVYKDGNVYFSDAVYTHYEAWRAIYEYGPGSENIPTPEP